MAQHHHFFNFRKLSRCGQYDCVRRSSAGYLYAEALGGTLITVIFILTITALVGSLVVQWRQAQMRQQLIQVAITAMEEGKYNYQHKGQLGELPKVRVPYKLVRTIHATMAHGMMVKELEVIGYYEQQEILHFKTYVWEGILSE